MWVGSSRKRRRTTARNRRRWEQVDCYRARVPETLDVSAFKHVVVPIGVIIGLGVARTMTQASHYIHHGDRVQFSAGHAIWCVILFLWFVGLWWIAWGLRGVDSRLWSFFTLIFLMVGPCLLFLASSLLMPDLPETGELDLGARLEAMGRPFFLCMLGFLLWLAGTEWWLKEEPLVVLPKRALQGLAATIFSLGALFPSRRNATWLGAIALPLVIFALATVRSKLG